MPLLPGALFKGQDASPWFPAPGGSMDRARAVCPGMPGPRPLPGVGHAGRRTSRVWGGTSPDERDQLRRAWKRRRL